MIDDGDRKNLREFLASRFNLADLKSIAFDLGIDYETISHTEKITFSLELVTACERQNKLSLLIHNALEKRFDNDLHQLSLKFPLPDGFNRKEGIGAKRLKDSSDVPKMSGRESEQDKIFGEGTVLIRKGNIFEGGSDLTVIPCSAKGTVSSTIRRLLSLFNLPTPLDLQLNLRLGDVSHVIEFPGDQSVTRNIVFAASVFNDFSSSEAIENISYNLGELTRQNSNIRLVETPLLGTGAGGLNSDVSGEALFKGFKTSAAANSTLYIFVFDTDRFNELNNLISRL